MKKINYPNPDLSNQKLQERVFIVVANYNTKNYIAYLIFSLYRILGKDSFYKILVVDNGSSDGSVSMLLELKKNNLIELIVNEKNLYHGPALNQAFTYLAAQRKKEGSIPVKDYVWILDSDTIILRKEALRHALDYLITTKTAALGEFNSLDPQKGTA